LNLVFAGHRCCDHSPSSGYDQICALFPDAGWLSGPQLAAGRMSWIREPSSTAAACSAGSRPVFHVFYGDCSGSALPAILRARFPQAVVISTVHQPVGRLKDDPAGRASLHSVDAIIAISRMQAFQLAELGLTASVHVVPHGVWTHVFRPPPAPVQASRDSVLLVGNYLRDWDGAQQIVGMLADAGVRSVVLGSAVPDRLSMRHPLVEICPRVPEAELAAMYHRSAALLLPVLDATASNALLEAMAAGCPVICPRFPALVDYLGDAADSYLPGRYEEAAARALTYVRQPERRAIRSHALMHQAREFDWARLRPLLAATYRKVADRSVPPAERDRRNAPSASCAPCDGVSALDVKPLSSF
jgi:glycosyltransferase involved in cell wall biosynthesis